MPIYLKMLDKGGSPITGDCQVKNHEQEIEVISWGFSLEYSKVNVKSDIKDALKASEHLTQKLSKLKSNSVNTLKDEFQQLERLKTKFYQHGGGDSRKFMHQLANWQTNIQKNFKNISKEMKQKQQALEQERRELIQSANIALSLENDEDDELNLEGMPENFVHAYQHLNKNIERIDNFEIDENDFEIDYKDELEELSQHEPLELDKRIDSSSSKLLAVCCEGQPLTSCTFKMYRPMLVGASDEQPLTDAQNLYLTVILKDANIVNYHIEGADEDMPIERLEISYDVAEFIFAEGDVVSGKRGKVKPARKFDWKAGKVT
ncbi:type VI secretion system tube protein Hcp [Candidatus Venteria ishoeyi]|uniref:Uncharacterized protein n=1 Tax=Candidatus Venteria ishoeyi TaxID=1899563 RepID=A0A1H6FC97_9GAMM|nr:type VI secretion system tube protein Hcp [Candidatus Venteria ishoeyi]MDM8546328.1 type VI secretion system tube protein Hcp [Candidatus Venteria ishoeyi]SEH06949.1 Uncharacterised protein [Candidatus Venteria ishoeyi]